MSTTCDTTQEAVSQIGQQQYVAARPLLPLPAKPHQSTQHAQDVETIPMGTEDHYYDRLANLCREAGTSVGAGVFALVGLVMMELYESLHPNVPLDKREHFIASFPLNPRPFFNYTGPPDSCMLAFSDGIAMPFLPSYLPLEGRLKLLSRAAHRQLKQFQKRKQAAVDAHSPLRTVATNYIIAVEMLERKLPERYKQGLNPQGAYPPNFSAGLATCGVSSVGLVRDCAPGKYDLDAVVLRPIRPVPSHYTDLFINLAFTTISAFLLCMGFFYSMQHEMRGSL